MKPFELCETHECGRCGSAWAPMRPALVAYDRLQRIAADGGNASQDDVESMAAELLRARSSPGEDVGVAPTGGVEK